MRPQAILKLKLKEPARYSRVIIPEDGACTGRQNDEF